MYSDFESSSDVGPRGVLVGSEDADGSCFSDSELGSRGIRTDCGGSDAEDSDLGEPGLPAGWLEDAGAAASPEQGEVEVQQQLVAPLPRAAGSLVVSELRTPMLYRW